MIHRYNLLKHLDKDAYCVFDRIKFSHTAFYPSVDMLFSSKLEFKPTASFNTTVISVADTIEELKHTVPHLFL